MDLTTLSIDELNALITGAKAEVARRTPRVRASVFFNGYNSRRYGRPWIGRVSAWPVGGKPEIEFGSYVGDDDGGEVEMMVTPGDIVRYGQRDNRGHFGSNEWAVVEANSKLRIIDQVEARKLYGGK
jgi:hypothetical protein